MGLRNQCFPTISFMSDDSGHCLQSIYHFKHRQIYENISFEFNSFSDQQCIVSQKGWWPLIRTDNAFFIGRDCSEPRQPVWAPTRPAWGGVTHSKLSLEVFKYSSIPFRECDCIMSPYFAHIPLSLSYSLTHTLSFSFEHISLSAEISISLLSFSLSFSLPASLPLFLYLSLSLTLSQSFLYISFHTYLTHSLSCTHFSLTFSISLCFYVSSLSLYIFFISLF